MLARLLVVLAAVAFGPAAAFPLFYRHVAPRATSAGVEGNIRIPSGYKTTLFSDGFDSGVGTLPSTARWTIDTGTGYAGGPSQWGTGEVETYSKSTANLKMTSAGTLQITPIKTTSSSGAVTWTSGRIESAKAWDFACAVGKKLRIEARLKLGANAASQQLGLWQAFWSLGSAYRGNYNNWPAVGEVDVLEAINGQAKAYETVHCGTGSGGPCKEPTGISTTTGIARGAWYTVAVVVDRQAAASASDWQKESISWLINEKIVFTVKATAVANQAAWTALAHNAKFVLLNVSVGGAFPTAVAGKTTPTSATVGGAGGGLEVDYVAVFST